MHSSLVSIVSSIQIWLVLLAVSMPLAGHGAVPANDTCAGAENVSTNGPFPYLTGVIDVTDASNAGDPPLPPASVFDGEVTHSVWYRFVPATNGLYTMSVGADTLTTISDTSMVMYHSTAGCDGVTNLYAFNEDSGLLQSAITTNLMAGDAYYIVVWVARVETATNNLLLQLRVTKAVIPDNDTCATPEVIPGVLPRSGYVTAVTDNTLGTKSTDVVPSCAPVGDPDRIPSRDVWYQFTPASTGHYVFSTKVEETQTTVEDTMLAIYTSDSGCNGPFTQLAGACSDNSFSRAAFTQTLDAATTYYIVLWDNSPEAIPGETSVQLKVSPTSAPAVLTLPVLSIASTGAVLRGSINANGLRSDYWFEWGPTSSLDSSSRSRSLFPGSTTTVNLGVQPPSPETLQPNIQYYYRLVASNVIGATRGEELTFMWSDTPPRLEVPVRLPDSDIRLQFNGQPSQLYLIQSSTNLAGAPPWGNLGLGSNTSGNVFQFVHRRGGSNSHRLYRIELP